MQVITKCFVKLIAQSMQLCVVCRSPWVTICIMLLCRTELLLEHCH